MIRPRSLLSVATLAALGVVLTASTGQAGSPGFLDPSKYFASDKDSHDIVLTSGEATLVPHPNDHLADPGANANPSDPPVAGTLQPGSQDGFLAAPRPVGHWLHGDG